MPFTAGESVSLKHTGDPETTAFHFEGRTYTLANGGLELKRKSTLKVQLKLPKERGKYPYEWSENGETVETGHLRVQASSSRKPPRAQQPEEPEFTGVRARRA